jgi:hypothetical protein
VGNALKYLLQGFQSSYNRAAEDYQQEKRSNDILNRQIAYNNYKDQQEKDALEAQTKNDNSFIIPLLSGKRLQNSSEVQVPLRPQRIDLTPEEKNNYLSNLSSKGLERFKTMEGLNKPKLNQKLIGKKVFQTDEAGNIDFTKPPIYTEPEKPERPTTVSLGSYYDSKTDSWKQQHGIPITGEELRNYPVNKKINGQLYGVTNETMFGKAHTTNENGNKVLTGLSKQIYGEDFNKQQRYLAGLNTVSADSEESQKWKQGLVAHNIAYTTKIKNNMPESARKWYQEAFNVKDSSGKTGNPNPEEYWSNLIKSYINGGLGKIKGKKDKDDVLDFQYLRELFRATYGFDPVTRYGLDYAE